jgi:hypothetical protein
VGFWFYFGGIVGCVGIVGVIDPKIDAKVGRTAAQGGVRRNSFLIWAAPQRCRGWLARQR